MVNILIKKIIIILVLLLLTGCAVKNSNVTISIRDADEKPLEGASITLEADNASNHSQILFTDAIISNVILGIERYMIL